MNKNANRLKKILYAIINALACLTLFIYNHIKMFVVHMNERKRINAEESKRLNRIFQENKAIGAGIIAGEINERNKENNRRLNERERKKRMKEINKRFGMR